MERLWEFALRHPWRVLALTALLLLGCLPGIWLLRSDNTPHVFFRGASGEAAEYAHFRLVFGGDEALRLVLHGDDVLASPAALRFLGEVERAAASLPGVRAVAGLSGLAPEWPPRDASVFRVTALADPLWKNLGVVADGGRSISILLSLEPLTAEQQTELLRGAEELLSHPPAGFKSEVVGMPALNRALDEASHEVEWKYFPLLVLAAAGLLFFTFRSLSGVLLPMVFVGLAEIELLGPMGYLGVRLNMVLAVLAPLVLVIALATAVYVQVRFHNALAEGMEGIAAVRAAFVAKRRPLVWTSVTTLVGFGALILSDVGPVRALGLWCVVATLEMLLTIFLVYPALLAISPAAAGRAAGPEGLEGSFQRLGRISARWAIRHRAAVIGVTAAVALLGLLGFPRLRVEGNALEYLPQDHPVRAAIERLERAGVGSSAVELVLDRGAQGGSADFTSAEGLSNLAFLSALLRDESGAIGVVGLGDVVDAALRHSEAPGAALGGGAARAQALIRMKDDPKGREAVQRFLSSDASSTRITLFVRAVGLEELTPVLDRAQALAREQFPGARVVATGEFPLLLDMQRGLMRTLAGTLALALVAVAAVFVHLLRSWRFTPLAVVTSLVPVVVVIGGMGWAGIPLDIATVMIASIVLGLAGDDTIHTVDRFRILAPQVGRAEAVAGALEANAPAYVVTALIRIAGFGVCAMAGFVPIQRFGALSALAIALAALTDLVVVAALLGRADPALEGEGL